MHGRYSRAVACLGGQDTYATIGQVLSSIATHYQQCSGSRRLLWNFLDDLCIYFWQTHSTAHGPVIVFWQCGWYCGCRLGVCRYSSERAAFEYPWHDSPSNLSSDHKTSGGYHSDAGGLWFERGWRLLLGAPDWNPRSCHCNSCRISRVECASFEICCQANEDLEV